MDQDVIDNINVDNVDDIKLEDIKNDMDVQIDEDKYDDDDGKMVWESKRKVIEAPNYFISLTLQIYALTKKNLLTWSRKYTVMIFALLFPGLVVLFVSGLVGDPSQLYEQPVLESNSLACPSAENCNTMLFLMDQNVVHVSNSFSATDIVDEIRARLDIPDNGYLIVNNIRDYRDAWQNTHIGKFAYHIIFQDFIDSVNENSGNRNFEFELRNPNMLRYGVRFNDSSFDPDTRTVLDDANLNSKLGRVQRGIDTALMKVIGGVDIEYTHRQQIIFPDSDRSRGVFGNATAVETVALVFALTYAVIGVGLFIWQFIAKEKRIDLMGYLTTMGVRTSSYWIAHWLIWVFISFLVSLVMLLFAYSTDLVMFNSVDFGVHLISFWSFMVSLISFVLMLSSFTKRTGIVNGLSFALIFIISIELIIFFTIGNSPYDPEGSGFVAFITFMSPWWHYMRFFTDISFKLGDGVESYTMDQFTQTTYQNTTSIYDGSQYEYSIPGGDSNIGWQWLLTFIYLVLTWYLAQVLSGEAREHPLFFINPQYWGFYSKEQVAYEGDHEAKQKFLSDKHGDLRVHKISKVYESTTAVKELSLTIKPNEVFCLLGRNGAGKTTLVNMLTGKTSPTYGSGFVKGYDLRNSLHMIRRDMGVVPQHNVFFNELTAKEHLDIFFTIRKALVKNSDFSRNAEQIMKEFGLDKYTGPVRSYSGGMKRSLLTAVATVGSPSTIFLDEPTTGMDPVKRRIVWNAIENLKSPERIIVLTTHNMEESEELGNTICIMEQGKLKALGTSVLLKKQIGAGYQVSVLLSDKKNVGELKKVVEKEIPNCDIVSENGSNIIFGIPSSYVARIPTILKWLEKNSPEPGQDVDGGDFMCKEWGISESSLQEVFLRLTAAADAINSAGNAGTTLCQMCRVKQPTDVMLYTKFGFPIAVSGVFCQTCASLGNEDKEGEEKVKETFEGDDDIIMFDDEDEKVSSDDEKDVSVEISEKEGLVENRRAKNTGLSKASKNLGKNGVSKFVQIEAMLYKNLALTYQRKKSNIARLLLVALMMLIVVLASPSLTGTVRCEAGFVQDQDWGCNLTRSMSNQGGFEEILDRYSNFMRVTRTQQTCDVNGTCTGGDTTYEPLQIAFKQAAGINIFDPVYGNFLSSNKYFWEYPRESRTDPNTQPAENVSAELNFVGVSGSQGWDEYLLNLQSVLHKKYGVVQRECWSGSGDIGNRRFTPTYLNASREQAFAEFKDRPIPDMMFYINELSKEGNKIKIDLTSTFYSVNNQYEHLRFNWGGITSSVDGNPTCAEPAGTQYQGDFLSYHVAGQFFAPNSIKTSASFQQLPKLEFTQSDLYTAAKLFSPIWALLACLFLGDFVSKMIEEDNENIAHMLFISGLTKATYYFGNWLYFVLFGWLYTSFILLLGVLFGVAALTYAPIGNLFLLCFVWAVCQAFLAIFIAACFKSVSTSSTFVALLIISATFDTSGGDNEVKYDVDALHPVFSFKWVSYGYFIGDTGSKNLMNNFWTLIVASLCLGVLGFLIMTLRKAHINFFKLCTGRKGNEVAGNKAQYHNMDKGALQAQDEVLNAEITDHAVQLRNVYKSFGSNEVLKGLSFGVNKGECFGFLGPNGAGKSTTISLLSGLLGATGGKCYVDGKDCDTELGEVYTKLGVCAQQDLVWPSLTVGQHLRIYARIRGAEKKKIKAIVKDVAASVGLDGDAFHSKAGELSGGMKRRLSIGISLIGNPTVWVLDEPTTGLDPDVTGVIWKIIEEQRERGKTIILTSHSMIEVDTLASRIGIIVNGKMRVMGSQLTLKSLYGNGFKLKVSLQSAKHKDKVLGFLKKIFKSLKVDRIEDTHLSLLIPPYKNRARISTIFKTLQVNKQKLGVQDFSIDQTSLEEVFLNIAKEQQ